MIGIYLICFFAFPAAILVQVQKREEIHVLFEKEDSNTIKGIAACFIVLVHLTHNLKVEPVIMKLAFAVLSVAGGIGVLLFFFVSGYGIYKGYAHKQPSVAFLYKRLLNIYLPCIVVQLFFRLLEIWQAQSLDLKKILSSSLAEAWFIYVIMIQYIIFYISWSLFKNRQIAMILLSFIFSMAAAAIFYTCSLNARWYNGLLLFPIGMTIAHNETRLIEIIRKKWLFSLIVYFALFVLFGGAFTYWKGASLVADMLKVLSGTSMCLFFCTIYTNLRLGSCIMQYIGERSLFYYLVHLGLREVASGLKGIDDVKIFYVVLPLTIIMVEIFYRVHILVLHHISEGRYSGKNI